jgi:hypothetical protein
MNASFLLQHSFTYGALLSALMSALFLTGACLSPDVMLRGYPPDIKAKYGAISEQGNSIRKRMVAPLFLILLGTPIVSLIQLAQANGGALTFGAIFLSVFIPFMIFNLVDLVILDWLIFVTLQPKFTVLPGTEGLAGYKDYAFHFKAFLRGTVL